MGQTKSSTTEISSLLMGFAGNPYGTYDQEEKCLHCGKQLLSPPRRGLLKKIATKLSIYIDKTVALFEMPRPKWMHVKFLK